MTNERQERPRRVFACETDRRNWEEVERFLTGLAAGRPAPADDHQPGDEEGDLFPEKPRAAA